MKRIRLLGVALMTVFAVSAIVAATASAAEPTKILPEPSTVKPLKVTSKSGAGSLITVSGEEVKCKTDKGTSEFTTPNLGTFHALFEGCTGPSGTTCTGESGDAKGTILLLGEVHYLLALLMEGTKEKETTKLVPALAFLFKQFHFTCSISIIKVLVLVRGCAAAFAEPTEVLTKKTKDVFTEWSQGESQILLILPPEATKEVNCLTETHVGEGEEKFELSAQKGTAENEKFEQGGKEIEIELMNK